MIADSSECTSRRLRAAYNSRMKDRVLLIGSYPPPYGGCSVHVQRLNVALQAEKYDVGVIDLYGVKQAGDDVGVVRCGATKPANALRAIWSVRKSGATIVHFHVAGMESFLLASYPLMAAIPSKARTILTVHSGSFVARFAKGPVWRRTILRDVLRRIDYIIAVNQDQRKFLENIGVPATRLRVVPAFLPPVGRASARAQEALQRVRGCERLVVASGYGQSHYGFHVILDAIALMRASGENTCAIFCAYNTYDERYMKELEQRMNEAGLGTIVRDFGPDEFAWVLQQCDTYVRATDRDGDAVAIREALYFGKAVIASDCVERPRGTRLFETDDARSLERALRAHVRHTSSAVGADATGGLAALLKVYEEALSA